MAVSRVHLGNDQHFRKLRGHQREDFVLGADHDDQVAYKIAGRITEKTGLQRGPNQSLDDFLEASARQIRDTARFRSSPGELAYPKQAVSRFR